MVLAFLSKCSKKIYSQLAALRTSSLTKFKISCLALVRLNARAVTCAEVHCGRGVVQKTGLMRLRSGAASWRWAFRRTGCRL